MVLSFGSMRLKPMQMFSNTSVSFWQGHAIAAEDELQITSLPPKYTNLKCQHDNLPFTLEINLHQQTDRVAVWIFHRTEADATTQGHAVDMLISPKTPNMWNFTLKQAKLWLTRYKNFQQGRRCNVGILCSPDYLHINHTTLYFIIHGLNSWNCFLYSIHYSHEIQTSHGAFWGLAEGAWFGQFTAANESHFEGIFMPILFKIFTIVT